MSFGYIVYCNFGDASTCFGPTESKANLNHINGYLLIRLDTLFVAQNIIRQSQKDNLHSKKLLFPSPYLPILLVS